MNQRIKELADQAELTVRTHTGTYMSHPEFNKKFAELIINECTQLLFDESERLYAYASECDNVRHSDEAEVCAEKCIDNIALIEQHFGVQ